MLQVFKNLQKLILPSLNGDTNEVSVVRLQSYFILLPILIMVGTFLGIEIQSFAYAIYHAKTYVLSNEIIIVFGMLLSHHLALLFSRNKIKTISEINESINNDKESLNKNKDKNKPENVIINQQPKSDDINNITDL